MYKNVDFLKESLIAHRGLHNKDNPENSIGAFIRAVSKGYIIELDVHLTKDNEIVVFHDDNLKRMTGIDKDIKFCNKSELDEIHLNNTKYVIPTLIDVLKVIDGKVAVIIEIKYDNKVGKLEKKLVQILDNYKGYFVIKSFRPSTLLWFRINRPKYIRGGLISFKYSKILDNYWIYRLLYSPDFISCNYKLGYDIRIQKIRKKTLILGWTIKNKSDFDKYSDCFDNLICENIEN